MRKLLMMLPLVLALCFVVETSNAQFNQNEYTITLQDGKKLPPGKFMIFEYRAPGLLGSDEIYYHFEEDEVETHRTISLNRVESIEFIANEENTTIIERIMIGLWDGSKVVFKKSIDSNDFIEEISPEGESKTYQSTGFLCYKKPKESKSWCLRYISANCGKETFRDYYYKIKLIKFIKE